MATEEKETQAAVKIQAQVRGKAGRRRVQEERAAVKIQARTRGKAGRKKAQEELASLTPTEDCTKRYSKLPSTFFNFV